MINFNDDNNNTNNYKNDDDDNDNIITMMTTRIIIIIPMTMMIRYLKFNCTLVGVRFSAYFRLFERLFASLPGVPSPQQQHLNRIQILTSRSQIKALTLPVHCKYLVLTYL